eukprot:1159932-Rhodomonas_salina.3
MKTSKNRRRDTMIYNPRCPRRLSLTTSALPELSLRWLGIAGGDHVRNEGSFKARSRREKARRKPGAGKVKSRNRRGENEHREEKVRQIQSERHKMSQTPNLGGSKGNESQRILQLEMKRKQALATMEETKQKIVQANQVNVKSFNSKFGTSKGDIMHDELGKATIGLKTLEELRQTKEELARKETILEHLQRAEAIESEDKKAQAKRKNRKSKLAKTNLSFGDDLDEDAGDAEPVKKRIVKDSTVDTSFLPGQNCYSSFLPARYAMPGPDTACNGARQGP